MQKWALAMAAAVSLMAPEAAAQSWRYEASRDPFTDQIAARAHASTRSQSMNVRCQDDRLEVYFWAPGYLGDGADVRYRFDDGEVRANGWDTSTDGGGAFVPGPGEFARLLMTSNVLNIEIEGEYGAAQRYRFALAGSGGPIGRVLDACGVPRHETYVPGGPIWRRAVEALESVPRSEVEAVARVLSASGLYEGEVTRSRPRALYQALSDFYAAYWSLCLEGDELTQSCRTWRSRRQFDADADYPAEPIELLGEVTRAAARPVEAAAEGASPISWARQPPLEFPERALSRGVREGSVALSCTPQPNGSLTGCSVVSETPAGAGFGQAALSAARRARLSPSYVDGRAAGPVEFTVRYSAPEPLEPAD